MPRTLTPQKVLSAVQALPIFTFPGPNSMSKCHSGLLRPNPPTMLITKKLKELVIPSLKLTAVGDSQAKAGICSLSWCQVGGSGQVSVMCNSLQPDQWTGYTAPPEAYTAYLTPHYTDCPNYIDAWEQCPSFPGVLGRVARSVSIRTSYTSEAGEPVEEAMEGFKARVFQHEFDHGFGITLVHPASAAGRLRLEEGLLSPKFDELAAEKDEKMTDIIQEFMKSIEKDKQSTNLMLSFNLEKKIQIAIRAVCSKEIIREFYEDFAEVMADIIEESDLIDTKL